MPLDLPIASWELNTAMAKVNIKGQTQLQKTESIMGHVGSRPLDPADVQALSQGLIDLTMCNVQYLFFQHQQIGDVGIKAIAEAMVARAVPRLLTVDLTANSASDAGFVAIVNAIGSCRHCRDLIFKQNRLTDVGMSYLHQMLHRGEWPNLARLDLSGAPQHRHAISDASFVPFAQDVSDGEVRMVRLEELMLDDNDVGDAGLAAFSVALQRGHLRKLASLQLNSNRISDEGARALAAAISRNRRTVLTSVGLAYQLDEPGVTEDVGQAAIEEAGDTLGLEIDCFLGIPEEDC